MASLLLGSALALAQVNEPPKYTGPGSCASPSCHGSVQARAETQVFQNEYSTWVVKDKHARALAVLTNPVATRMAKILGLEKSADKSEKCTACHALDVPESQRARTFDSTDGVSCEACHGPASNWLGPHTTKGWTHQKSIEAGMRDLRDPIHRAENCLTCHLGMQDKFVDHEMIAAGHPDLYFELASFTAAMPKHWREQTDKESVTAKDPWVDVRLLATGQAVQLGNQLKRLAWNAQGRAWPEYADLDCFACHHSLTTAENSWQQERGYAGRRAGNPPWNLSRYVVLKQLVNEFDIDSSRQLEGDIGKLYGMVSSLSNDRAQIAAQANSTAELAGRIAQKVNSSSFDQAATARMMKAIAGDADYIARQGERPAEQAIMALQSLYNAYASKGRPSNDSQIQAGFRGLFQLVENPSAYSAPKFSSALAALGKVLP